MILLCIAGAAWSLIMAPVPRPRTRLASSLTDVEGWLDSRAKQDNSFLSGSKDALTQKLQVKPETQAAFEDLLRNEAQLQEDSVVYGGPRDLATALAEALKDNNSTKLDVLSGTLEICGELELLSLVTRRLALNAKNADDDITFALALIDLATALRLEGNEDDAKLMYDRFESIMRLNAKDPPINKFAKRYIKAAKRSSP